MQSSSRAPSIEDLYFRVQRALKNVDLEARNHGMFEDPCLRMIRSIRSVDGSRLGEDYLPAMFLDFDPAPWKTQLDSLAALITSIRIALLARLLEVRQSTTFMLLVQALPVHGFFESRVNKRNAP